jgi:hypothetical protein
LALGALLLGLCFITRASLRSAEPATATDETHLTSRGQGPTTYYAVFGNERFWRHAFTAPVQAGSILSTRR